MVGELNTYRNAPKVLLYGVIANRQVEFRKVADGVAKLNVNSGASPVCVYGTYDAVKLVSENIASVSPDGIFESEAKIRALLGGPSIHEVLTRG
jgi:hypothetical protein